MKVLAMYLPQFHNVVENNLWWGEGFTEWTAVKGAKKLFEDHDQPRVPQDNNYYNLLDKDTMIWQSNLMKMYGVDGMCIYHYWFKDGRQILEKPAENLLKWDDIDMPFCFSWANETWARSWSNIREKNVWANTFEDEKIKTDTGILLEQKYGTREDWIKHFDYLLPFFQDPRYIKIDGKPVFLIYLASIIPCLNDMKELWDDLSKAAGFPGIYIIGSRCNTSTEKVVDAVLHMQPRIKKQYSNQVCFIDYESIWNTILKTKRTTKKTYLGAFVGYDDTPRRGAEGTVILNSTPEKFSYYLSNVMAKSAAWSNEFVFLNAWNEWGEGMYLEPDEKYGYKFLEATLHAKEKFKEHICMYEGDSDDGVLAKTNEIQRIQEMSDKFESYLNLLDDWMTLREDGVKLAGILEKKSIFNVAIYGFGILGRHFLNEVKDSNVKVEYIVDQQRDKLHVDIPVYLPTEQLPKVDAIIISATFFYREIAELLKEKEIKNIISLESIIKECI